MRSTTILVSLFLSLFSFSQKSEIVDSCIYRMRLINYSPFDSNYTVAYKPVIKNIISRINACQLASSYKYKLPAEFTDRGIQLLLPAYLPGYSFGLGDNNFYISFDEYPNPEEKRIILYYDFADSYKDFFLKEVREGRKVCDSSVINERIVYYFKNWDDKYAGIVFPGDHLVVAYYSKERDFEESLRKCINSVKVE